MRKVIIIIIFIIVITIIFSWATVNAQQVSLSISPPLLELFIKPGKSIMVAYQIENQGDPVIITTKILPFEPKDNLGNIRIKDEFEGPVRFSLDNADLELERPFFLKTKDSQQVLLRIRIPENIPDGDYYYSLLAETQPPTANEGMDTARAKATIGSNILITITESGTVEVKPKIVLFSTRGGLKIFDSTDKIPIVLVVENQGKNLIKPEGEIVLKGNFGEKATYDIIPKNILAESQRLLEATPSAQIDCDKDRDKACLVSTSLILSGFFIGKYQLSTTLNFGDGSPNIFASTYFFAFPFKISAGILLALFITILIIKRKKREEE